jgi:hypothetical protein
MVARPPAEPQPAAPEERLNWMAPEPMNWSEPERLP